MQPALNGGTLGIAGIPPRGGVIPFVTLRRHLLSAPLMHWLRRRLPPLSATER
ncbi:hypothetical protein [Methylomarinovum caldicuralii]|uniref:hypothetical protein n=1 Tax=Methylomarinovum caldicuralii TaxID=438856 RepID=UPI002952E8F4|nr:hypothetical protein [Methylomarinovum caldicuralii]